MKNLRTHMWISFTLGVFLLVSLILAYAVLIDINQPSNSIHLMPDTIRIWVVNLGLYIAYFLIVLFKAIKYAPSKA